METNEKTPNHTGDAENGNVEKETGKIETIIKKSPFIDLASALKQLIKLKKTTI